MPGDDNTLATATIQRQLDNLSSTQTTIFALIDSTKSAVAHLDARFAGSDARLIAHMEQEERDKATMTREMDRLEKIMTQSHSDNLARLQVFETRLTGIYRWLAGLAISLAITLLTQLLERAT